MADTATPALPALTGAGTVAGDWYVVHDTSANALSRQAPAEVMNALVALGATAFNTQVGVTAVLKTLYDAQTILAATVDDTPAALPVAVDTVIGRLTGGNIASLSVNVFPQLINTQAASYSVVAADVGKLITMNSGSALNLTVPQDSDQAIPVGCFVEILQLGIGQVTVVAGTGATLRATPTAKARAQYSRLFVQKIAANTWALAGDLAAS